MKAPETLFAIYDDDEFVAIGTKYELAETLGVRPESITFMATPSARKRNPNGRIAIKVKQDESDE